MLYKRFPLTRFVLAEKRIIAYNYILSRKNQPNIILFDDLYQHRSVKPKVNILLCDFEHPFYNDFLMPLGRLRERRIGAKRADIIIVTKIPEDFNYSEQNETTEQIHQYSGENTPVFYAFFKTLTPVNHLNNTLKDKTKVVLLSAIANNASFRNSISKHYFVKKHFEFSDHHFYTAFQLHKILKAFPDTPIICTEKDYYKIIGFFSDENRHLCYFAGLKVEMKEEAKLFDLLKKLNIP